MILVRNSEAGLIGPRIASSREISLATTNDPDLSMSLYFDAVSILTTPSSAGGSFKSRIYSARNLRASPAQVYALIIEASKWDRVLAEVIEHADLLALERKVR